MKIVLIIAAIAAAIYIHPVLAYYNGFTNWHPLRLQGDTMRSQDVIVGRNISENVEDSPCVLTMTSFLLALRLFYFLLCTMP